MKTPQQLEDALFHLVRDLAPLHSEICGAAVGFDDGTTPDDVELLLDTAEDYKKVIDRIRTLHHRLSAHQFARQRPENWPA